MQCIERFKFLVPKYFLKMMMKKLIYQFNRVLIFLQNIVTSGGNISVISDKLNPYTL